MRKNTAPKQTQTTAPSNSKATKSEIDPRAEFLSAAFSLSWQLAIIVLLPVIGGYKIDEHFRKTPMFTVIGFVIAIVGVVLVLKQTLAQLNERVSK